MSDMKVEEINAAFNLALNRCDFWPDDKERIRKAYCSFKELCKAYESQRAELEEAKNSIAKFVRVDASVMKENETLKSELEVMRKGEVDLSAIQGAVARGWCHTENCHKAMDADLALAIAEEVAAIWPKSASTQRVEVTAEEPLRKALEEIVLVQTKNYGLGMMERYTSGDGHARCVEIAKAALAQRGKGG